MLARLSEWTGVKEEEKRRRGPYPLLQLCLGALLIFAAVVPENHLYRESSGQQTAQDPVVPVIRSENGETLKSAVVQSKVKTDPLNLNAHAAVLLDGDTGRILYGKNEKKVLPMASTTKIMTCILALENSGLDTEVEISDRAASMPEVKLHAGKGEKYRLEDLLYSLMLESHNDTAVAIAEAVGGSVENFADMMNGKAAELGCDDTYFLTPNGLDAEDKESGKIHSTTAADLARILRYCISLSPAKEEFLAITRAPSHAFSDLSGTRSFSCVNHNALLTSMEGAVSGKTGFTGKAGYCYVGAVKKDEKLFIAALLDCGWPPHRTYKWEDMGRLLAFGDENYDFYEILKETPELPPIPVKNGIGSQTGLTVGYPEPASLKILMNQNEPVTIKKKVVKELTAPVAAGMAVGQVDYYVGEDLVASFPVTASETVGKWDLEFCVKTLLNGFLFCYNG